MRIVHRYFITVFGLLVLALTAASIVFFWDFSTTMKQVNVVGSEMLESAILRHYKEHGTDLSEALAEAMVNPVMLREYQTINEILAGFLSNEEIVRAYVYNDKGGVIADGSADFEMQGKNVERLTGVNPLVEDPEYLLRDGLLIFFEPMILDGDYIVGGVALEMTTEQISSDLQELRGKLDEVEDEAVFDGGVIMLLIAATVLVLGGVASYYIASYISKPIRRIAGEVGKVDHRDMSLHLPVKRDDEIGVLAEAIAGMAERLRQMDEFKTNLVSSVSHELRTPLTSILGFAKLIRREFKKHFNPLIENDDKLKTKGMRIRENLEIIEQEASRLTLLINDVLDLNKIESGNIEWRFGKHDLREVVERAAKVVAGDFVRDSGVELKMMIPPNLPRVTMDPGRIVQVMVNLLNNAAKFTEQGVVTVRAAAAGNSLIRVAVKDTGIGIPVEKQVEIFEKFRQISLDTIDDKPKGTGLGLAICKEIIEYHGGTIGVTSTNGKGSTFYFTLPVEGPVHLREQQPEA